MTLAITAFLVFSLYSVSSVKLADHKPVRVRTHGDTLVSPAEVLSHRTLPANASSRRNSQVQVRGNTSVSHPEGLTLAPQGVHIHPYYMQEGATITQACFAGVSGSCTSYAGFSSIYIDVVVENSPYPTGFELNGYTSVGDWFQSTVTESWSCGVQGMFLITDQVWNNVGTPSPPTCFSNLTIKAGDDVELGLVVSTSGITSGDVCMTVSDLTNPQPPFSNCVPQPDGGSTPASNYFAMGGTRGYFTGPMTEIADPTAVGCLSYSSMP